MTAGFTVNQDRVLRKSEQSVVDIPRRIHLSETLRNSVSDNGPECLNYQEMQVCRCSVTSRWSFTGIRWASAGRGSRNTGAECFCADCLTDPLPSSAPCRGWESCCVVCYLFVILLLYAFVCVWERERERARWAPASQELSSVDLLICKQRENRHGH